MTRSVVAPWKMSGGVCYFLVRPRVSGVTRPGIRAYTTLHVSIGFHRSLGSYFYRLPCVGAGSMAYREPRRDARGTELSGRSSVKSPARPRCSRTDSGTLSSSPVSLTPPRRADTMPATWQSRSELTASSSAVSQVAAVDESLRRSRSLPPPGSPGSPKYPESIGSPGSPSSPRSPSDGGVHIPGRGKGSHGRRLYRYGQLRLQDVLVKRLGEAGKNGPDDLLIISPTSIGAGMDSKFMEVGHIFF